MTTSNAKDVRFSNVHWSGVPSQALESTNSKDEKSGSSQIEAPPYDGSKLEKDPKLPPPKGFEWRGKGAPGSKYRSWYNPEYWRQFTF